MAFVNDKLFYVWRGGGEVEDQLFIEDKTLGLQSEIPMTLFDELVVMRYAQLEESIAITKVQRRAYKKHGGGLGCVALAKKMKKPIAIDLEALVERREKGEFKKRGR